MWCGASDDASALRGTMLPKHIEPSGHRRFFFFFFSGVQIVWVEIVVSGGAVLLPPLQLGRTVPWVEECMLCTSRARFSSNWENVFVEPKMLLLMLKLLLFYLFCNNVCASIFWAALSGNLMTFICKLSLRQAQKLDILKKKLKVKKLKTQEKNSITQGKNSIFAE